MQKYRNVEMLERIFLKINPTNKIEFLLLCDKSKITVFQYEYNLCNINAIQYQIVTTVC